MGFARDLGAAMTFGLSVTTRHKEAETKYGRCRKQHEGRLNAYNEVQAQIQSGLEAMDAHFAAAQEILLSTGALTAARPGGPRLARTWTIPTSHGTGTRGGQGSIYYRHTGPFAHHRAVEPGSGRGWR